MLSRKWDLVGLQCAIKTDLGATSIFGEFLNCSLRDHFVFGIRNPVTPKKLMSEDRTFQEALQVAIADEMAGKETLEV